MSEIPTTRLTVRAIGAIVAQDFGVSFAAMAGQARSREFAEPRQVTMWICQYQFGFSLPQIGKVLGDRDHTTVLHGRNAVEARRVEDEAFAGRLAKIVDRINAAETGMLTQAVPSPVEVNDPKPVPQVVWKGPSPAQRHVLDALASYLTARDVLTAHEHTKAELGARRHAETAYRALREAYSEMKAVAHDARVSA